MSPLLRTQNRMVRLVEKMLDLQTAYGSQPTARGRKRKAVGGQRQAELIERQIKATDWSTDELVHESYGLSDREIRMVKDAMQGKTEG